MQKHEEGIDFSGMTRDELVQNLEELLQNREVQEIIPVVEELESAYRDRNHERKEEEMQEFLDEGGYADDFSLKKDKTDSKFSELFNLFQDRKDKFFQQQKEDEHKSLQEKKQIITDLKQLIESGDSIGKAFQKFRELRDRWRNTGNIPTKQKEQLESDYRFQMERFYHLMRITQGLKEIDLERHLAEKNDLLKKMEALLEEKSIKKTEALLRKYHEDWYDVGPVPELKKDSVIKQFNEITDKIYEKIGQHYESLKQKYNEHLRQKETLCEKVEAIANEEYKNHREWEKKTKELLDIQTEWRKIGRVPKEESGAIWDRFRTTCNEFFQKKRAFYQTLKKDYEENKGIKQKICEQAEALKNSEDWENTSRQLIKLQKQWQKSGPAGPPKVEQQLWKQFRAACDTFFEAKKNSQAQLQEALKNNLTQRENIIQKLKDLIPSIQSKEALTTIEAIAAEWKDAGNVPDNAREEVFSRYSKTLDEAYEKMGMDESDMELLKYKNKIDRLKNSDDAVKALENEKKFLRGKIRQIEDEAAKIENNMGFFAKSKKTDELLKGFQDDLAKHQKQVTALKKKLELVNKNIPEKAQMR